MKYCCTWLLNNWWLKIIVLSACLDVCNPFSFTFCFPFFFSFFLFFLFFFFSDLQFYTTSKLTLYVLCMWDFCSLFWGFIVTANTVFARLQSLHFLDWRGMSCVQLWGHQNDSAPSFLGSCCLCSVLYLHFTDLCYHFVPVFLYIVSLLGSHKYSIVHITTSCYVSLCKNYVCSKQLYSGKQKENGLGNNQFVIWKIACSA